MEINSAIVTDLRHRNKKAFEIVYNKYYRLVYFIAFKFTKDEQLSLDIMQETFIKLMSNIENYFDDGRLKQYIAMIATNISKNELKKRENQNAQLDEDRHVSYSYNDNTKVEIMVTLEKYLSPIEIDVVTLKVLFDYTFKEIAEELNTTIGQVQSTYYKAMEILKNYFQSESKGE